MQLKITHDIENNIFTTNISIDSFGTEQLSADDEKELINDFPTKLAYRNLTFTKNVKITGSVPVITSDAVGEGVVAVTLPPVSNKEITIDEEFNAVYRIDINKIAASALDAEVLKTKELVAQAYCLVFDSVITAAVQEIITALRAKAPAFAGEELIDV